MARRSGSSDPRAVRTHQVITEAALRLVREKRVEEISIAEIVKMAGVSRQAFYEHFEDRDDAVATAVREMSADRLRELDFRPSDNMSVRDVMSPLLQILVEERPLYENLHLGPVQDRAIQSARDALTPSCRVLAQDVCSATGEAYAEDDVEDTTRFLVGGVVEILVGWMRDDIPLDVAADRAERSWRRMRRLLYGRVAPDTD